MTLMTTWTRSRGMYEGYIKPKQGSMEKVLVDFNKKSVLGIETTVKAIDAAIAKKDVKTLLKLEANFHKQVLDLRTRAQVVLTELKKATPARASVVEHAVKVLQGQVQDLKAELTDLRQSAQSPSVQLATEVVPPKVFDQLRQTPVTRDPSVAKFTGGKEFGMSVVDGTTALAAAAKEQQTFKKAYGDYLTTVKKVDVLKGKTASRDMIGAALAGIFNELERHLNVMSSAVTEWERPQAQAMRTAGLSKPPTSAEPTWTTVQSASHTVADEYKRLITLREAVKKLLPRQFN